MPVKRKAKKTAKKKVAKVKKAAPRTIKKKAAAKKAPMAAKAAKAAAPGMPRAQVIGEVTHFFPHVSAGVVKLTGGIKAGDTILIKGHTTDFKQKVASIQIDHVPVNEAQKGAEIGLKIKERVRIGDVVYKI